MSLPAEREKVLAAVTPPSSRVLASATAMLLPDALSVLWKSLEALPNSILPVVEARVVTPLTTIVLPCFWVMSFDAETSKVPAATTLPSSRAFISQSAIFIPEPLNVSSKSLVALSSTISPLVEARVVAPAAVMRVPDFWVMLLPAERAKVPVVVILSSTRVLASATITSFPEALSVLWKSLLELSNSIFPLVEARVVTPETTIVVPNFWVMSFAAERSKVPATATLPSSSAFMSHSAIFMPEPLNVP